VINCHLFAINCIADVGELISEGDYHRNIYFRQPGNRPISGGRGLGGLRTGSFAICQFFETGDQQRWQRNEKNLQMSEMRILSEPMQNVPTLDELANNGENRKLEDIDRVVLS